MFYWLAVLSVTPEVSSTKLRSELVAMSPKLFRIILESTPRNSENPRQETCVFWGSAPSTFTSIAQPATLHQQVSPLLSAEAKSVTFPFRMSMRSECKYSALASTQNVPTVISTQLLANVSLVNLTVGLAYPL